MHKRLKTYQFAAIVGAVVVASVAPSFSAAAAPLCSKALLNISQKQIDAAIDDFANLSRYVDQLQVTGTTDAKYSSARNAQKAKEQELLSTLNISRDELRKIVKEKNNAENIQDARATRKDSKSRDKQDSIFRPLKAVLKNSLPFNVSAAYTQALAANGQHLAIMGIKEFQIVDLVSGEIKVYEHEVSHQVGNSIFSFETKTREQIIITDLNDGRQKTIPPVITGPKILSTEKDSILSYQISNGEFKYVTVNSNGDVIFNGKASIAQIEKPNLDSFIGEYVILKSGVRDTSYYLLSLKTNSITLLPLDRWDTFRSIPGANQLLIQNFQRTTFEILDLEYLYKTKHEFSATSDIAYIDKDIAWVETHDNSGFLKKVNLHDLTAPKEQVHVGDWMTSLLEEIPNTPFIMMPDQASETSSLQIGIYRKKDLMPALIVRDLYSENKLDRTPIKMWVSEDAKTMVVFSGHISEDPAKLGIEIWSLEKR